jgi:hypothetical protein
MPRTPRVNRPGMSYKILIAAPMFPADTSPPRELGAVVLIVCVGAVTAT